MRIKNCRICKSKKLINFLDLGELALTGYFPKNERVESAPLYLTKCIGDCGLVQLRDSCDSKQMYGMNYGYRSGLQKMMVDHLAKLSEKIKSTVHLSRNDTVIDIGSNDGTFLKNFTGQELQLVGIDPTIRKFQHYYDQGIITHSDFFSPSYVTEKAKVITSIAMFYDLEDPLSFMQDIYGSLAPDGVWLLEHAYFPKAIEQGIYDGICHEHIEYYSLKTLSYMFKKVGFQVVSVEENGTNGGSVCLILCKEGAPYRTMNETFDFLVWMEETRGDDILTYGEYFKKVIGHKFELMKFVDDLKSKGKKIFGYGASTKGNVLLQFCEFTTREIDCIVEVNEDKFGCFTPGSDIPIVPEAGSEQPDYYLVLPWHFKEAILRKKTTAKFIFPFPNIHVEESCALSSTAR